MMETRPDKPPINDTEKNFPHVEDSQGGLFIDGKPAETKESVFNFLEKRVTPLTGEEYEHKTGHRGLAHFEGVVGTTDTGKAITKAEILLNKDAFIIGDEDYSDLIPIVLTHEFEEFWTYAKTGYSFVPRPDHLTRTQVVGLAHGLALRKQYEYAFEIDKADRFLKFVTSIIENDPACSNAKKKEQIEENQLTFNLIKRRREKAPGSGQ